MFCRYGRFKADAVGPIPEGMSYAEAAAFPIPHLTAFMYIFCRLEFPRPSTAISFPPPQPNFLVWGGSSSVGHHAIQLGKLAGYRVITTASAVCSILLLSSSFLFSINISSFADRFFFLKKNRKITSS